jgi:Arc/MetJ-type ribon-helix-helix transcriptional regulator
MQKHRLQLDFSDEALKDLDALKETTGMPNRAEVIRQALRLLQWTLNETQNDATLLIEKGGRQREVIFPFWAAATRTEAGRNGNGR